MEFINLKAQYQRVKENIHQRINTVLEHGTYIMGPEVFELEEKLAHYVGVKHCIGVSSGTDALLIAMMALDIGPGDEVITTPFTFMATGEMISLLGATPVFADIDPRTYNIDSAKIETLITKRTKLIMPVSLYGQCSDHDAIAQIAKKHNLPIVEDAAQSFGATYQGRHSCSLSTIGCTSFFPSKPLGGYGDGGACFTNDEELATRMRQIRVHGQQARYTHTRIGLNGRLDTLQAAILLAKLEVFDEELVLRQQHAERYTKLLKKHIQTPFIAPGNTSAYAQYTLQVPDRAKFQEHLKSCDIPTAVHYPIPIHQQPVYKGLLTQVVDVPLAEEISKQVVSIPMHPYLSEAEQNKVAEAVIAYMQERTA